MAKTKTITLCGIDSSTEKTGISLFKNGEYVDSILIDKSSNKDVDSRINEMQLAIGKQLDKWKPDIVYNEETYFGKGIDTLKKLSYILGGIRYWCAIHKVKYRLISPQTWRSVIHLAKFGEERTDAKKKAMLYVRKKYGVNAKTDDISDSICIGEAGCRKEKIIL